MQEKLLKLFQTAENLTIQLEQLKKEILDLDVRSFVPKFQEDEIKRLLTREEWPESIHIDDLCTSEEDKVFRASEILKIIEEYISVTGRTCLDYGCGEGHLVKTIAEKAKFSIGYDIIGTWDLQEVKNHAPYDVIILYDVLDHAEDPVEILKKSVELTHDKSRIFIRFHPWCGRHGAHLYKCINKAFVQLFLNDFDCDVPFVKKITYPTTTYKSWLQDAKLKIISSKIIQSEVEPFFRQPPLSDKIKNIWGNTETLPVQMQIEFIDLICQQNTP